jgi:superoxide dismutase
MGITHTYTLSIYLKDNGNNQNNSQGATFKGKIVLAEEGSGDLPVLVSSPDGWENVATGTLLEGIKANYPTVTSTLTTPGQQVSLGAVEDSPKHEMLVNSTYQDYYWTYGTGVVQNADGTFNLTGVSTLKYSDDYNELVGKYIVSNEGASYNSSSSDTTKTYTNLKYIVQVQSAFDSVLRYKQSDSLISEAVLSSTEDDYGTSYYFRGAVKNNYVVFAGMCWRIVRITGDGSIKLTLYNTSKNTNPCSSGGTSGAFAANSVKYNASSDSNAYVGFMYGTAGSSTYDAEHENLYDSTILTKLKTWYDASFNETQQSLLADTIWCSDKRLSSNNTGTGAGISLSYYSASDRLYTVASASPSLKCGDSINDNKISKFTASDTVYGNGKLRGTNGVGDKEYKIGLLTADEVAFAGAASYTSNYTYYLYENASYYSWWTMSPYYSFNVAFAWSVGSGDELLYTFVDVSDAVRPAISLVSNVKITGGNGTSTNPFVIYES